MTELFIGFAILMGLSLLGIGFGLFMLLHIRTWRAIKRKFRQRGGWRGIFRDAG